MSTATSSASSDFEIVAVMDPLPAPEPPAAARHRVSDRVRTTAADPPAADSLPPLPDPAADHASAAAAPADSRRAEVDAKHARLIAWMDEAGYEAVVLGRADSVAWFTAGGDLSRDFLCDQAGALLYVNHTSRAVVCDNVQSQRIFEEELNGLGFQLKERAWFDAPGRMVEELAHRKRVATDLPLSSWPCERDALRALRLTLTHRERQELRTLGRTVTLAVEATCRNFMPGEHEADVAGHLAHRLLREGVVPVDLRVASDDRLERYRQCSFKSAPIHHRATIAVVGRRQGLCAGVTRIVSFGPVPSEVRKAHNLASMVDATCIYFSRPGETVAEVFRRARRIYEKFGYPDEWALDQQGGLTGYAPCEGQFLPDSPFKFGSNMALRWSPSVGPTRSEDTVVIDHRGYEVVTEAQDWPTSSILVKGLAMTRPGILERSPRG
jgi:Xaa-Pro aminopeptidase